MQKRIVSRIGAFIRKHWVKVCGGQQLIEIWNITLFHLASTCIYGKILTWAFPACTPYSRWGSSTSRNWRASRGRWCAREISNSSSDFLRLRSACSSRSIGRREASIYHGHWRSGVLHARWHPSLLGLLWRGFAMSFLTSPSFFCRLLAPSTYLYGLVFLSAVWERGQPFSFCLF